MSLSGRPGYIVESPEHPLHDAVYLGARTTYALPERHAARKGVRPP